MIGTEHQAHLKRIGREGHFTRGEVLFSQGDPSRHIVLIESGIVLVTTVAPTGYTGVLAIRSAGQLVGEFAGITGEARSATVTAITEVDAVIVDDAKFRAMTLRNPPFAMAVLRSVIARVREADQRRLDFGAYKTSQRVAQVLFERACQHSVPIPGQPNWLMVKVSRQELAGAAGASRESVTRALGALAREHIIQRHPRHIVVTSLSRLEASSRHDASAQKETDNHPQ
jgi:CRP-like cAMP-binding protein